MRNDGGTGLETEGSRWRRSAGWLGAGLAVLAALVAYVAFTRAPFFKLERLTVEGNHHLTQAQVLAATGVRPGESRWSNPASEVTRRLLQDPWIKDAAVTWRLGGELHVQLLERQPFALVRYHALYISVDNEARVLDLVPTLPGSRLPLVSGVQLPPLLRGDHIADKGLAAALSALVLLLPEWRAKVAEVTTGADTYMTMYLTGALDGTRVKLGRSDRLEEKISALVSMWQAFERDKQRPKSISLENPGQPSVCWSDASNC